MTLYEAMPFEYFYDTDSKAHKYDAVDVIWKRDSLNCPIRWPGTHKYVYFWVVLKNGYAVGWNENPSKGWSYPLIKLTPEQQKEIACNLQRHPQSF